MRNVTLGNLQERVYQDAERLLKTYGRTLMVWPDVIGARDALLRLMYGYKQTLYLYKSESDKRDILTSWYGHESRTPDTIPGVIFRPYTSLAYLSGSPIAICDKIAQYNGTELILCEHAEELSAKPFSDGLDILLSKLPSVHIAGATAVPRRVGAIDIVSRYFDGRTCTYSLHAAIQDGIIAKPCYCLCTLNNIGCAVYKRIPEYIKDACNQHVTDKNHMRFLAVFSSESTMDAYSEWLTGWVLEAYPDHAVRVIWADAARYVQPQGRTIDLIFSCGNSNIGNLGISQLTGVFLIRSEAVNNADYPNYLSQIITDIKDAPVIFDLIDGSGVTPLYEQLADGSILIQKQLKNRARVLEKRKAMHEAAELITAGKSYTYLHAAIPTLSEAELVDIISCYDDENDLNGTDQPAQSIYKWSREDDSELRNIRASLNNGSVQSGYGIDPSDLILISNTEAAASCNGDIQ